MRSALLPKINPAKLKKVYRDKNLQEDERGTEMLSISLILSNAMLQKKLCVQDSEHDPVLPAECSLSLCTC